MNISGHIMYIYHDFEPNYFAAHPKILNRGHLVHELIKCYGLLDYVKPIPSRPATEMELRSFHSEEYINFLKKANGFCDEDLECFGDDSQEFGLGYDNPLVPHLYDLAAITGGATIVAAEALMDKSCQIAVNWNGGWHHAKRDEAAGYCYINDVVLGILQLLKKFRKIMYIDLDLHHGDGVQDAFLHTNRVLCFSVHKYEPGFYPGTGSTDEIGQGNGKFYTVNVPLCNGVQDEQYTKLLTILLSKAYRSFNPDVVVCQCGADVLAGDPMKSFNLTLEAVGECIRTLLSWNVPLMLLGGGGYNFPNTARLWTYLLSLVVNKSLVSEIPEHEHLMLYGPDYELPINPQTMYNGNTNAYIQSVLQTVMDNLEKIV